MDIHDYSTRLTEARNDYWDSSKKLKENYDRDLQNLEKTHDYKTKKQADTYSKERLELEDTNKANSEFYAKKTKEEIDRRQNDFISKMKEAESVFNRKNAEVSDKFRDRLSGITESYEKSKNQSDLLQTQELRNLKEQYNSKNARVEASFNKELKGVQEKSDQQFYEYRKGQTAAQKDLISKQEDRIMGLTKDHNSRLSEQKEKDRSQLVSVIKTNAEEVEQLKNHHEAVSAKRKEENFRQNAERTENFSRLARGLEDRNISENQRAAKEHADAIVDQKDKFSKDLRNVRNLASQMDQESQARANNASLERTRMEESYEGRLQKLKNFHEDYKASQIEALSTANENFTSSLKQEKLRSADKLDKATRESELRESQIRAKGRNETVALEERYTRAMSDQANQYDTRLDKQEKGYKDLMKDKQLNFQRTIERQNLGHELALNDMHESMSEEKTRFIEETKRKSHNDIESLKADLTRSFGIKLETLENQLAQKELELERTIVDYDERLLETKKKSNKEIDRHMLLESDRRAQEREALKHTVAQKDSDNAKKIADLRRRFDSEMAHTKHNNDIQVKKLVEQYEDELTRVKNDANKDLKIKLGMAREEYEKLKVGSELRLQSVKDQYDMKIEQMRLAAKEAEINRGNRINNIRS